MTQQTQYRVVATCLTTYSTTIEATSAAEAGELAFLQEKIDWPEIGDPDWQVDRVEPMVAQGQEPALKQAGGVSVAGKAFADLLSRRTHLLKLITNLTQTLERGAIPAHAAQHVSNCCQNARMELKGLEAEINKAVEGGK